MTYDQAFARTRVAIDDPIHGILEGRFGLVNSERIRCTLASRSEGSTAIYVEAIRPPGTSVAPDSLAVDTLVATFDDVALTTEGGERP